MCCGMAKLMDKVEKLLKVSQLTVFVAEIDVSLDQSCGPDPL